MLSNLTYYQLLAWHYLYLMCIGCFFLFTLPGGLLTTNYLVVLFKIKNIKNGNDISKCESYIL